MEWTHWPCVWIPLQEILRLAVTVTHSNPTFAAARDDLVGLGFEVALAPTSSTRPFAVIAGRTNARWWLLPVESGALLRSGLALFQPASRSAALLRFVATAASRLRANGLISREVLHVAWRGGPIAEAFPGHDLRFAIFTGTDSPHRKCTIQVMDPDGRVVGYAKAGRAAPACAALDAEATNLENIRGLGLAAAVTPRLIAHGTTGSVRFLITDGSKTPASWSPLELKEVHFAFLTDLRERSRIPGTSGEDWLLPRMHAEFARVAPRLSPPWRLRLERALEHVRCLGPLPERQLHHGDFTPWNCFLDSDRLHVFDWEYASYFAPPAFDLMHFLVTTTARASRQRSFANLVGTARRLLPRGAPHLDPALTETLIVAYLCEVSLRYSLRVPEGSREFEGWPEHALAAGLLDQVTR